MFKGVTNTNKNFFCMTFMGYVEVHLMDLALQRGNELHKFTKVQLQLNTFRIVNLQMKRLFTKI